MLKNGKGLSISMMISLVVFLFVAGIVLMLTGKIPALADSPFNLGCILNKEECKAQEVKEETMKEATKFLDDAIKCAYYRCLEGCKSPKIQVNTEWAEWCRVNFCSDTSKMKGEKQRICDDDAKSYPVKTVQTKDAKLKSKVLKLPNSKGKEVDVCILDGKGCNYGRFGYGGIEYVVLEIPKEYLSNTKGKNCHGSAAVADASIIIDNLSIWAVRTGTSNVGGTDTPLISLRVCKP